MSMMPEVVIRPWRADDLGALARLNAELQETERALRSSRRPGADMTEDYMARTIRLLEKGEGAMYVAIVAGEVVGLVVCVVEEDLLEINPREVRIRDLVVTARHRGAGIGRALFREVRSFARRRQVQRCIIGALDVNEAALAAYRAWGFTPAFRMLEIEIGQEE